MTPKNWFFFPIFLLWLSVLSHAQLWSGILDPTRAIDWTAAGVQGGIPTARTQCGTTIQASTYGDGSADATSAIQSALNACAGTNQVVSLSAGTFRINANLSIPSNITLRGAGANQTILSTHGAGQAAIYMGKGVPAPSYAVKFTNDGVAGDTNVNVTSTANFAVNEYVLLVEYNNPALPVTNVGDDGACTWCDEYWNGSRVRGQIAQIVNKTATTLTISPGLYSAYSTISGNAPYAVPLSASTHDAGLENLQIYSNNSGYTQSMISMSACMNCWIKGLEDNYADNDHVWVSWGFHDEIRDSYFSNDFIHGTGSTNGCLLIARKTSASLIENNIFDRLQVGIMVVWGPAGNVIAYNYATGLFMTAGGSYSHIVLPLLEEHAPHPQFNLIEGNVGPQIMPDGVWGSQGPETLFRNWTKGAQLICSPTNNTRATVTCGSDWAYQASRPIALDFAANYFNAVGNVIGSAEQTALIGTKSAEIVANGTSNRPYEDIYGWTFGYSNAGDTGTGALDNNKPYTTVLRHGNYNNIDGSLRWVSGLTQTLPPSFYRSAKPAWWGSLPWPAIGPDVTGGNGPGGHVSSAANPAVNCYLHTLGGTDGGAGSPLTFSADMCYSENAIAPPTGLAATVR